MPPENKVETINVTMLLRGGHTVSGDITITQFGGLMRELAMRSELRQGYVKVDIGYFEQNYALEAAVAYGDIVAVRYPKPEEPS